MKERSWCLSIEAIAVRPCSIFESVHILIEIEARCAQSFLFPFYSLSLYAYFFFMILAIFLNFCVCFSLLFLFRSRGYGLEKRWAFIGKLFPCWNAELGIFWRTIDFIFQFIEDKTNKLEHVSNRIFGRGNHLRRNTSPLQRKSGEEVGEWPTPQFQSDQLIGHLSN